VYLGSGRSLRRRENQNSVRAVIVSQLPVVRAELHPTGSFQNARRRGTTLTSHSHTSEADVHRDQPAVKGALLNYFVGNHKQRVRNGEAQRVRRLHIHNQFEAG
jgi:hypothetical protein